MDKCGNDYRPKWFTFPSIYFSCFFFLHFFLSRRSRTPQGVERNCRTPEDCGSTLGCRARRPFRYGHSKLHELIIVIELRESCNSDAWIARSAGASRARAISPD